MTHAFFKALLFMAAGSVIGAMAGNQSLDRMGGFRKALPFTFACFIDRRPGPVRAAAVLRAGCRRTTSSRYLDHRGGGFVILGIAGYVGALMTGVYTFRMIFRAFFGDPCPRRSSSSTATSPTPRCRRNPMTGEEEDTDVGFPGPEHFIAEREWPMKIAMSTLAVLAVVGGVLQIPGVDDAITKFLDPTFADSRYAHTEVASARHGSAS